MKRNNKKQMAELIAVCGVVAVTIVTVICSIVLICKNLNADKEIESLSQALDNKESSEETRSSQPPTQQSTQVASSEQPSAPAPTQPSAPAPTQPSTPAPTQPSTPGTDNRNKKVYLTFDDGPSANTDVILDTLKKYNVKATFFVAVPTDTEASVARYKRIIAEGHTLAIHTYTHDYNKIYANLDSFIEDVTRMRNFIYDNTGYMPRFYRFPGGSSNSFLGVNGRVQLSACKEWLANNNLSYFDWNVSSGDANSGAVEIDYILYNVLEGPYRVGIKDTSVVLMHDSEPKTTTAQAVDTIVSRLLAENYQILPITDDTVPVRHR